MTDYCTDIVRFLKISSSILPPWIFYTSRELIEQFWLQVSLPKEICAFELDGKKMRTLDGCWDEFISQLKFPSYFGRNLAAFHDCLTDTNIMPCNGYLIIINHANNLLVEEAASALEGVISAFMNSAVERSESVKEGELWDRPATPFHLVLAT
jgi:RNAse (barnase) inhibitor barstar